MKKILSILAFGSVVTYASTCGKSNQPKFKEWEVSRVERKPDGSGVVILKKYKVGVKETKELTYGCLPDTLKTGMRIDDPEKTDY